MELIYIKNQKTSSASADLPTRKAVRSFLLFK